MHGALRSSWSIEIQQTLTILTKTEASRSRRCQEIENNLQSNNHLLELFSKRQVAPPPAISLTNFMCNMHVSHLCTQHGPRGKRALQNALPLRTSLLQPTCFRCDFKASKRLASAARASRSPFPAQSLQYSMHRINTALCLLSAHMSALFQSMKHVEDSFNTLAMLLFRKATRQPPACLWVDLLTGRSTMQPM